MLSKKTKYALHALTYLANQEDKKISLISEIAKNKQIPRKFLETILLELKKNGILSSKMGKGGGYFMLQLPADVKVSTIVRLFDGPIALLPCASKNYYQRCEECPDETHCGMHRVFTDVRDETLKVLENKSIQDILDYAK